MKTYYNIEKHMQKWIFREGGSEMALITSNTELKVDKEFARHQRLHDYMDKSKKYEIRKPRRAIKKKARAHKQLEL